MLPLATLLLSLSLPALAADKKADAKADDAKDKGPTTDFKVKGTYQIWGLNQRGFLLGRTDPAYKQGKDPVLLDNADYVVQMLRVQPSFDRKTYGVAARFDAAQGWWGVDNDPNVVSVESTDPATGATTSGATYNPYKLFRNKDTNYTVHFDHAYGWFLIPGLPFDVKVQAGRQYMGVGHKMVLDQDLDGITVQATPSEAVEIDLMAAKMSEGFGSYKAPTGAQMSDERAFADANLFGGQVWYRSEPAKVEAYGLFYKDMTGLDDKDDQLATFLPQGYGYFNSRFRPNISQVVAVGLSADGKVDVAEGLLWSFEGSYLTGKDQVDNTDHAGGILDKNDGTLSGYNVYASLTQKLDAGLPLAIGVLGGMGSGDDDVTKGAGNVNKIQTMGLFPLTNVWEDSVMPDVGGISPQGLGSPVSRGYRELENTTAAQGKLSLTPAKPLTLDISYTWLHATQPIVGWDATGTPTRDSSQDIGSEVDVNANLTIYKGLSYRCLFGYFMPGEGAELLINGATSEDVTAAWEVKQVLAVGF